MPDETITQAELAEALRTHQLKAVPGRLVNLADPDETAAGLFAAVIDAREPRYETGEIYEDDDGERWHRNGQADLPWTRVADGGWYPPYAPMSPLRKLVPEVAREPAPAVLPEGEPLVVPGWMYEDRIGQRLYRAHHPGGWLLLPEGTPVPDDCPVYPLRKLVPEAEPSVLEAKLDRITGICRNPAAAVGEVMGPGRHVPGDRLAAAILAVIRGEGAGRG